MAKTNQALKILIADDSPPDRMLLQAIVEGLGYEVVLAADGVQAVEVFARENPHIVLLDALMPRLDGMGAARQIKAKSADRLVPIIFLTSLREAESLAECLEAGGDDFLSKPYNPVILQAKIRAFHRMVDMHDEVQFQRDQIARHNEHLINEQEVAKRVFDKVAHAGSLDVTNLRYRLSPLAIFNGDVLLAAVRPSGNISVLLGDFTGHGLAAAIGAMPLAQTFYSMNQKGFAMKEVLCEINAKLKSILPVGVFCCATMVDLNIREQTIEVWNGGLPDNLLYRNETQHYELLPSRHVPLGVLSPQDFNAATDILKMHEGDRIFMWSDGIIEAVNERGEMFGEKRLLDVFNLDIPAESLFPTLNECLNRYIGAGDRADDLSLVEVVMVNRREFELIHAEGADNRYQGPMDWGLCYELRADTLKEFNPLPVLLQILMDIPGLRTRSGEIYTVLSELYNNALEHGILRLDSGLKKSSDGFTNYYAERSRRLAALEAGYIHFEFQYKGSEDEGVLAIEVSDSGDGFDHAAMLKSQQRANRYSGRGYALLNELCDDISYLENGNRVRVRFDWSYQD